MRIGLEKVSGILKLMKGLFMDYLDPFFSLAL